MKRWLFLGLAIFALVTTALVLFYSLRAGYVGQIIIANQSGEIILSGRIRVCGQAFEFQNLASGDEKLFVYNVTADSGYTVDLKFENGRRESKQLGYVTNGMNFKDTLVVTDQGVTLGTREISR